LHHDRQASPNSCASAIGPTVSRSMRHTACSAAGGSIPANRMLFQLEIAVAHAEGQARQRRQIIDRGQQIRGQGVDLPVKTVVPVDSQRLAQPGHVLGGIVDAQAHAGEFVVEPVERAMETRHQGNPQRAPGPGWSPRRRTHRRRRSAAATVRPRPHVDRQTAVPGRDQARCLHAQLRQSPGDRIDVVVDRGGKDRIQSFARRSGLPPRRMR